MTSQLGKRNPDGGLLGPRFEEALVYATRLHARQKKKGTDVPYIAHLLGVASIVLTAGGDEDMAIAALLHDAVEDQGGLPRLYELEQKFGKRVASLVDACTDSYTLPQERKPDWRSRKDLYLRKIAEEGPDARLVSTADKLHNARQILSDYREHGDQVWLRFTAGRDGQLWYYRELVKAFRTAGGNNLLDELDRVVTELENLVSQTKHLDQRELTSSHVANG
jgi:(p)ppGpp synthase/HD superfamily hydrolase